MLTAALAGAAGWLFASSHPDRRLRRLESPRRRRRRAWRMTPVAAAALGVFCVVFVVCGPGGAGWSIAGAIAAGTATWLILERRQAQAARRRSRQVADAARLLASLLRSGQIPTAALQEAAADHPLLAEASSASSLGANVPDALRRSASRPGAGGLRAIAAAWHVSERSGAPIAGVLEQVAENLRQEHQLAEVVETELSSARASGHIMAVLPFGAVGLGFLAGGNPLDFIFGAALGQWLALVAVALTAVGVVWTERLAK
ncbi:MAG: type II secretion system F family protein [Propionibacteriaceae bacterium]|nr:type II secretion system F family protein [Propionibacteriaceae bacterium]